MKQAAINNPIVDAPTKDSPAQIRHGKHQMKTWDVFLAAGIRQPGCYERNERLIHIAELAGLAVFSPARESPPELSLTPLQILSQNRSAILSAPIFLFVPDGAGIGVYYELGLAEALQKEIIAY